MMALKRYTIPLVLIGSTLTFAESNALLAIDHLAVPLLNTTNQSQSSLRQNGVIKGRVVTDSGQPIVNVTVHLVPVWKLSDNSRSTKTDEEGKFRFDDLTSVLYIINSSAKGYYAVDNRDNAEYCKAGDFVSITMAKGGVITGLVTNSLGEPIVAMEVEAIRLRDLDGNSVHLPTTMNAQKTDDRGVYRLYGLEPGVYLVAANGRSFSYDADPIYGDNLPTYYPSATRDLATKVVVYRSEVSGIDIHFRSEQGHVISGSILSTANSSTVHTGVYVQLNRVMTNEIEAQTYSFGPENKLPFAVRGIPDGEYYLSARREGPSSEKSGVSTPVRVRVKGADVTGLQLALTPLCTISGQITVQVLNGMQGKEKCERTSGATIEGTAIVVRHDEKEIWKEKLLWGVAFNSPSAPTKKGDFVVNNVTGGRVNLEIRLPDENWYINAITWLPRTQSRQVIDVAREGLELKPGEHIVGVKVALAEGAALVRGRIISSTEGEALPKRLKIHLVPIEPEYANEPLHFAETNVESDGTFEIKNLTPGRYSILALSRADEDASAGASRPMAWSREGRVSLHRRAAAINMSIDLRPCQHMVNYTLRYNQ